MSLVFGATIADRVALAAGLDNQHAFTNLIWFYMTTDTDLRRLWSKGGSSYAKDCGIDTLGGGGGDIYMNVARATTLASARSAVLTWPTNVWNYGAFTYDGTDGPRIFRGTLTSTAAEASYFSRAVGAGAETSDSGGPWVIGNEPATFVRAFQGRIAFFAHYRRRFSLAEVVAYQWRPLPDADCDIYMHLGWQGTAAVTNWAPLGTAINGTVTGTVTNADHPPLPLPPWAGMGHQSWTAAAAPAGGGTRRMLLGVG